MHEIRVRVPMCARNVCARKRRALGLRNVPAFARESRNEYAFICTAKTANLFERSVILLPRASDSVLFFRFS